MFVNKRVIEDLARELGSLEVKWFGSAGAIFNGKRDFQPACNYTVDSLRESLNRQREITNLLLDYLKLEVVEEGKRIIKK